MSELQRQEAPHRAKEPLALHRESLQILSMEQLEHVVGGDGTNDGSQGTRGALPPPGPGKPT